MTNIKIITYFCVYLFSKFYQAVGNNVENCGGNFSGYQYTINSPNYPANYPEKKDCIYFLHGIQPIQCEPIFYLQFLDFDLEATTNCEGDYLKVGGHNIFCGSAEGLRKFRGDNNALQIIFHTGKRRKNHKGFKILVTTSECATNLELATDQNKTLDNIVQTESSNIFTRLFYEGVINNRSVNTIATENPQYAYSKIEQEGKRNNIRISSYLYVPPIEKFNSSKVQIQISSNPVENVEYNKISPSLRLPEKSRKVPFRESTTNQRTANVKTLSSIRSLPLKIAEKKPLAQIYSDTDCDHNTNFLSNSVESAIDNYMTDTNTKFGSIGVGQPSIVGGGVYPSVNVGIDNPVTGLNPSDMNYYSNNYNPGTVGFVPSGTNFPTTNPNWNNFNPNFQTTNPNWNNFNPNFPTINPSWNNNNGFNYYPNSFDVGGFGYSTVIGGSSNYPGYGYGNGYNGWPYFNPNFRGSECCTTAYSQPRFLLSSPGFPNIVYSSVFYECIYMIQKSSPDICQIRINFKFFNLGSEDPFCSNGYLDIEGQRICGCKTGFSIVSPFINFSGKNIGVRYVGIPRTKFNGFLIEIVQESCNYNYRIRYKKDVSKSVTNNTKTIENLETVSRIGNRNRRELGYSYPKSNANFHKLLYPGGQGNDYLGRNCQPRLLFDYAFAAKEAYLRNARCPGNRALGKLISIVPNHTGDKEWNYGNCEVISSLEGVLSSPGYPLNYANNMRKCYRFHKDKHACRLQISILDFDLEASSGCMKDYIAFSQQNRRYCGQSLTGQQVTFDLSRSNFVDLYFKSDSYSTGRGFNIRFIQNICRINN